MRAEHLHQWLIAATWDDTPNANNWKKFTAIVQTEFWDGKLAKECMWKTIFLISKGNSGNFRGVGLVEVLWKTMSSLLNQRITAAITLHDVLHGFRAGRGIGTASL